MKTNAFYRKYEPYQVNLCNIHVIPIAFCYFLQALEESKSDMVKILKYLEPSNCSRTILDSAKQTKRIFEIRVFSHPLNFFSFLPNLFLYSQNKLFRKYPRPGTIRPLSPISPLTGILTYISPPKSFAGVLLDSSNINEVLRQF